MGQVLFRRKHLSSIVVLAYPDADNDTCVVSPDAVMHVYDAPVSWGNTMALFDMSPHIKGSPLGTSSSDPPASGSSPIEAEGSSSRRYKHLAWARSVRSASPRAFILGVAFDANEFYQWVVKDDGTIIESERYTLPGRMGEPLDRNAMDQARGLTQFLIALDTLALCDRIIARSTTS